MGAGKTTVGKELASRLDTTFLDLDQEVERTAAMSIPEIFAAKGEAYFRQLEEDVLKEIVRTDAPAVIALGGGTPTIPGLMEFVNGVGTSVWIDRTEEELFDRLLAEKEKRPLIAELSPEGLKQRIAGMLDQRIGDYSKAAIHIPADVPEEDLVGEIVKRVGL